MTAETEALLSRLGGVNTLLKLGKADEAVAEIQALSTHKDAASHADLFLDSYLRLEKLDEASAFLDQMDHGSALSGPQRLKLGLRLMGSYRAQSRQSEAIRELMKLRHLAKDEPNFIVPLTDAALDLHAMGLTQDFLDIMERMPNFEVIRQLYAIQLESLVRPYIARLQAAALLSSPCKDLAFWERLIGIGARLGAPKVSLQAAKRFFKLSGGTPESRKSLVFALVANNKHWSATRHLKVILQSPEAEGSGALRFAELSIQCRRPRLAIAFLSKRHVVSPTELEVTLLLCETCLLNGEKDRCRIILDELAKQIEHGLKLTQAQFIRALDVSRHDGRSLTQRLARLALTQFPDDVQFIDLIDTKGLFDRQHK